MTHSSGALRAWPVVRNSSRSLEILDYGCGPGAFLALLRDEFGSSNVEGLELSRASVEFARQHYDLTVASSTPELRRRSYDCVTLIEVIEHLPHPGAIFEDNPHGRFFPPLCGHYTAPSHISLFTQRALNCLLSRHGSEIMQS